MLKHGDFEHACPKFKQRCDRDAGGRTQLELAECYGEQGKFASSWGSFKAALATSLRDNRPAGVECAKKQRAIVEHPVSRFTLEVPNDVHDPGLSIWRDGASLRGAAWDIAKPVDPSLLQLTASEPSKRGEDQTVQIERGSTSIEIPKLEAREVREVRRAPFPVDQDVLKKPVVDEPKRGNRERTVGFVIGGAGIVALGAGSYFGLHAMSKWSDRNHRCSGGCTEAAKNAGDDAKHAALISNIGFGVGIIAAGVGTYLVHSAKATTESTRTPARPVRQARSLQVLPVFGPRGGGLVLRGNY